MTSPRRIAISIGVVLGAAIAGVAVDAHARRTNGRGAAATSAAIARATGSVDLALSSGARWLRHPTSAEPAAGCSAPTCLDTDPAGLALPPPRETFATGGGRTLFRVPEAP